MDGDRAPTHPQLETLLRRHRGYGLRPFAPILADLLEHLGRVEALRGRDALELGPGRRLGLMRWLLEQGGAASVQGVGLTVVAPWTPHRAFLRDHVCPERFLPFLARQDSARWDLIVSRWVFEQHSIDPGRLLTCRDYWAQFRKADFRDFDERYPASLPNLRAVFREAWRCLRPGGLIVSLIGKRRFSALDPAFLRSLEPTTCRQHTWGPRAALVTLVK